MSTSLPPEPAPRTAVHTVVGAGALGSSVARRLVAKGHRVRIVTRRTDASVPGAETRRADISDAEGFRSALAGSSTVYHCAQPAYHRWAEEFPALQTAVLDASAEVGADLVIADNLYMYGRPQGRTISESTPEHPASGKGEVRRKMAEAALDAHRQGRLRVVLSRPSTYFGPGYDQVGESVFRAAGRGKTMQFIGRPDVLHSLSYVPDAAEGMIRLGASDDAWGQAWIPPVQPALTQADFAQLVWKAAGQAGRPKVRYIGRPGIRLVGLFSPTVRAVAEMMYGYDEPYVVDSSRFEKRFGAAPTPIAEAVAETLRAYPAT